MKKLKKISGSAGFLGYKVNISFVAEKLIYSQICGTKVGPSYKKTASYSKLEIPTLGKILVW